MAPTQCSLLFLDSESLQLPKCFVFFFFLNKVVEMLGREKNCNRREMLTKFYFVVGVGEGRPDLDPIRTQYGAFVYWQHVTPMYTVS